MPNFPSDVITEILSRLLVKSLLRFRCVSKHWCTLIDSPYFIKLHLKRSMDTNLSLIIKPFHYDNVVSPNPLLKLPSRGTILLGSSCNGLLCFCDSDNETFTLWNPSTRMRHVLPVTPIEFPHHYSFRRIFFGFGYDHVNDDHKLVSIVEFCGQDCRCFDNEVEVYNLRTNSWRKIQDCPYYLKHKQGGWGMFASGALHWVANRQPKLYINDFIVAFDLGVEEYRIVPQPAADLLGNDFDMTVHVLGGCLSLMCCYVKRCIDVWVMKEYGEKESWTKLFSIERPNCFQLRPLAYLKNGDEVLLVKDREKLIWYDTINKRVKNDRICGIPHFSDIGIYVGSLVRFNGDSVIDGKKQQSRKKKEKRKR